VPKALASREAGADIVNIAQVFQRSGTLQVSFKDAGITSPADFAGKKIGNWGYGNEFEIFAALTKAGLDPAADVELVQQQFDMAALLAGDIDAAEAMTYNEYAQVLEAENPETGELYTADDFNVVAIRRSQKLQHPLPKGMKDLPFGDSPVREIWRSLILPPLSWMPNVHAIHFPNNGRIPFGTSHFPFPRKAFMTLHDVLPLEVDGYLEGERRERYIKRIQDEIDACAFVMTVSVLLVSLVVNDHLEREGE